MNTQNLRLNIRLKRSKFDENPTVNRRKTLRISTISIDGLDVIICIDKEIGQFYGVFLGKSYGKMRGKTIGNIGANQRKNPINQYKRMKNPQINHTVNQ